MDSQLHTATEPPVSPDRISMVVAPARPHGLPRPEVSSRFEARNQQEQRVLDGLVNVVDPCSIATGVPINVSDMGLIREVVVADGVATVKLRLTNPLCFQIGIICDAIEKKIKALHLDCLIEVDPNDDWSSDLMSSGARERLRVQRERPLPPGRETLNAQ